MKSVDIQLAVLATALLFHAGAAFGKNIYVSTSGSDANSGATAQTALKTIGAASAMAMPGDVVLLMPGRYTQALKPARSGSAGFPITFKSADAQRAVITHSAIGGLQAAIDIVGVSNIVVDGLEVDGVSRAPDARVNEFVNIEQSKNIVIRNSYFRFANGWGGVDINGSSLVTIERNFIDFVGQYQDAATGNARGDAIHVSGGNATSQILIRGNTVRHGGHNLIRFDARDSVIEENDFENSWADVLGGNKGYRIGTLLGSNNVYQRYYVRRAGIGASIELPALQKIEGLNNIARFNVFAHGVAEGISSSTRDDQLNASGLRIYNNTFYKLNGSAWRVEAFAANTQIGSSVFANNLVVDSRISPENANNDSDVLFKVGLVGQGATAGTVVTGNNFVPAGGKSPRVGLVGFDGVIDMSAAQTKHPSLFSRNSSQADQFVVAVPGRVEDFDLKPGSPSIDSGRFLSVARGSGRSNVLPVSDSRLFSDGSGVVQGDTVRLQGSAQTARVVNVDHINRSLELATTVDFTDGQGVAVAFEGTAPDVGARESGALKTTAPLPPSDVIVQ